MKKRFLLFLLALTLLLPSALAEPAPSDNALLYLAFDEGHGTVVQDRSGNLTDADIEYNFFI